MVQSAAVTVDQWLAERADDRRATFAALRDACRAELPGWEERMAWGMPGYGPAGAPNVVSFNDQKRHIAFYAGEVVVTDFTDRLAGIDCGKGCVRFRSAAQLELDLVRLMLRDIRARG